MRILYHFRTRGTGPEGVHIKGIAEAFRDLGHEVVFSSPTGVDPTTTAGSDPFSAKTASASSGGRVGLLGLVARHAPRVVFELMEIAYNAVSLLRNSRLVRRADVKLVYERHANFGCSTAIVSQWRGIPLVLEVNELVGDERVRAEPVLKWVALLTDRVIFSQARLIVVVSPHLKRRLIERGVDHDKIIVQPNAVGRREVEHAANPNPVRERYGLSGAVVVGFVGYFVPWHQLPLLIEAFATLRAGRPALALRLMLIGTGPLRDALEQQARTAGIGDSVIFAGLVPHSDVFAHIAAFDVAVVPSSNAYRSPIKLFEYMSQGCTVVAPATEPVCMVARDGETAVLFEPENPKALEAALARAVDDADLRQRIGVAARAAVLREYTWTRNAEDLLRRLDVVDATTNHAPRG
jgi:glycosyltransferase involved in cell wall biosynthesis